MAEHRNPSSIGQALIPAMSKLQDIFARLGNAPPIELPQVAVVGSQSSGKSSVLEALVGRDFLPRGSGICTRRPLLLQLVQIPCPGGRSQYAEWGEFSHLPGERFTDFSAIRREIEVETEREVGANKGVSDKQIRLKIFSPCVLSINLIDLPGITKVPVGDQPTDIEDRIRKIILSYIKHKTCIILAVSPANSDLANSDALQIARLADPDGSRTIGVITKLDIMDRGTDARNFLLGNVIPLLLGYIGVVNRSQEDIIGNKSVKEALDYEEKFFLSHPAYNDLADKCGIQQLAKKLNMILRKHIRIMLPDLKAQINSQISFVIKELSMYGGTIESEYDQAALLLDIFRKFSEAFISGVEGKNEHMLTSELSTGARIHHIFQAIFVKTLEEVDPCDDITNKDIQTAIQNATGSKNALFVPEVPFQVLVQRQIARLLNPSLQCVHFIYDELVKLAHRCETSDLQRFPVLQRRLEEVVGSFLREGLAPTQTMVEHLIEMEKDYINTSHPAFIGGNNAMAAAMQEQRSSMGSISTTKIKESVEYDQVTPVDKVQKTRAILSRAGAPGIITEHALRPIANQVKFGFNGNIFRGGWGISSIFGAGEAHVTPSGNPPNKPYNEPSIPRLEIVPSTIQLKVPPAILRPTESQTEQEAVGIAVTRLLVISYYDIVRKNIQDSVPKAIMHFLVNHSKRELHNVFIKNLYNKNLFAEMLKEREDISFKRKQCTEVLQVLEAASRTLDELPLD